MIKLIASDMDGTLLNNDLVVPEENINAIKEAQKAGIEFMIATGRGINEALPLLEKYHLHPAYITLNGAQVFDENEKVQVELPLNLGISHQIISTLRKYKLYFEMVTNQGIFSNSKVQRINNIANLITNLNPDTPFKLAIALSSARLELMKIQYVKDYDELLARPAISIFKIIAFDSNHPNNLISVKEDLLNEFNSQIIITSSSKVNIEINDIHAQKGIALKKYADKKGISSNEIMTLGDNINDTTMIQYAKYSVAMENAVDSIKKIANYITARNDQAGVARAIKKAIQFNTK
ncbi:MAG: Cof-type HAD-IIB family hydrolase [Bombilactobacillus mellifer]|nr:Cof-type HAD-IIB family hydrolase [Bombilactobacillus mellifer]